ncbi:Variant surface glycoprotein [Trypanosoma congolense IL3000]|uniref:VSG n=1 Tax=Trypanosoma congolense (strain IL3000) TaxID=1068625 RepID=F9W929_TRYCI|nr:Variant surface glycoprotein [Trypanosoma congolense IL3000]CCD21843.1 VSG [Trypanosoma congolense IL3000]
MMRGVKVMMVVVGLMGIGVLAEEGGAILDASHFGLLCNITKALTGVWETVGPLGDFSEREKELTERIDEVFFGEKEKADGMWSLPDKFTNGKQNRSLVCGSRNFPNGMPTASKSLASTILCLCTGITGVDEDLCGYTNFDKLKWSDSESEDIKKIFEKVWGDGFDGMFINNCVKTDTYTNFQEAQQNLTALLKTLEETLKHKTGTLAKSNTTCNGSTPCATIRGTPTWLEKLEKIEEVSKTILSLVQAEKDKVAKEHKEAVEEIERQAAPTTASEEAHQTTLAPVTEPVGAPAHVETHKQEPRRAPEEKSTQQQQRVPEQKTVETLPRQTDDSLPPPENETSGLIITSPKWLLSAAFLS